MRSTSQGHGIAEARALGIAEQASEAMLMGLRLAEGIDLAALSRALRPCRRCAVRSGQAGVLHRTRAVLAAGGRIGVTGEGMVLLDALLAELVPAGLVSA